MGKPTKKSRAGQEFAADKNALLQQGLLRKERLVEQRNEALVRVDGKWLVNFCGNDYLGLATHPAIMDAMRQATSAYGTGSSASPLVCGKSIAHQQLEQKLAQITGRDRVLLLSCGYMANLAVQSALVVSRAQSVVEDKLCHASMLDAAILSRSALKRYRHADPDALERILEKQHGNPALVLTESVFSMDGDIAPLPALAAICKSYRACLVVDDAHGFGVIGPNGLGAMDHFSLSQDNVPLLMATFGKAAGVYGAFVAGTDELIETLVQRARPYIYSTALPVPIVAAASCALDVMQQENWRRQRLTALIGRFRRGADQLGLGLSESITPIQPLIIGQADAALRCSQMLEQDGILVTAIRPPTVPLGSSRLRITISANHTEDQIDHLLLALQRCRARPGLARGLKSDD